MIVLLRSDSVCVCVCVGGTRCDTTVQYDAIAALTFRRVAIEMLGHAEHAAFGEAAEREHLDDVDAVVRLHQLLPGLHQRRVD